MSQYYIDGPVQVGTVATTTTVRGNVTLSDTTTSAGDIVYANSSNILQRLAITNNGVMIGTPTAPVWLAPGTNNQVLTMVSGSPAWAAPQADASQYGFFVTKASPEITTTGTSEAVIGNWKVGPYTSPEYDSTSGQFDPATGIFTIPGTTSDISLWNANVGVTFTQSSNNNNQVTDVHVARILLGTTVIGATRLFPAPRNNNLSTLHAVLNVNFRAKGTDQVTVDIACKNGGNVTVKLGDITWFGISKLANA